jgi:hypothetical protein
MTQLNSMEDFQRDISYRVLKREDGRIRLAGTLQDRFHDVLLEVVVAGDSLAIEEIRVDFRKAPSTGCQNLSPRLEQLVGLTIGKGLNRQLMTVLGGGEGCGNVRNMLQGLLPLALNVQAAAGIADEQEMLDKIHEKLLGTCVGYAKEPPA